MRHKALRYNGLVYFVVDRSSRKCADRLKMLLIRAATMSRLTHCMFGFAGVVIDPCFSGVHFRSLEAVEASYPGLFAAFQVPLRHSVDFSPFGAFVGKPQPALPRLWRYITRGQHGYVYDCVSIVLDLLEAGGVSVPSQIATPAALHRWMLVEGFRSVDHASIREARHPARRHRRPVGLFGPLDAPRDGSEHNGPGVRGRASEARGGPWSAASG